MKPLRRLGRLTRDSLVLVAIALITILLVTCDSGSTTVNLIGGTPIADPTVDADGDGWAPADNDCCDDPGTCPNPALVNPGAFEVLANGVDDDCNAGTPDGTAVTCSAAPQFGGVAAGALAQAMDICQTTTVSPPLATRTWGLISAELVNADGSAPTAPALTQIQSLQTAVLANYGTGGVVPRLGATMGGLSTGTMRDKNDPGYVAPNNGTDFGRVGNIPAVYLAAHGGMLPASASCSGNCPAGYGSNDSVNLRLTLRVPTNAQGFSYDFRFFSAEYWVYACTTYNDHYLALLTSGVAGLPADKNISFDALNNPVSVNNGFFETCVAQNCYACPLGSGELAGTGMEDENTGGATGWLRSIAPVIPGETIVLELMVFDVSDTFFDSLVLLDAFQWVPDPASVGTQPIP